MITVLVALGVIGLGGIVLLTRAGSEERAEYVDALVAVGESHGVAEANGECFAAATVDAIGIDALQDVASADEIRADPGRTLRSWGISLDERQAEEFYDEVNECIDTRQVYLDRALDLDGLTPDQRACVEGALSDDLLERWFVILWLDLEDPLGIDEDLRLDLMAAVAPCLE